MNSSAPAPSLRRWQALRRKALVCRACPLYKAATQTVFGEGALDGGLVFVGEQPGNQEDLQGHPFVGPAGALLTKALGEVGVGREQVYVTNAVKHFKFEPRGKLRLHRRANAAEQAACRHWLDEELALIQPRVTVALGSMAAAALFGRSFRLLRERGRWQVTAGGGRGFATTHPAYVLRQRGEAERERAYAELVRDLRLLAAAD